MVQPASFLVYPTPAGSGILRDVPSSGLRTGFCNAFMHGATKAVAVQSGLVAGVEQLAESASNLLDKMDVVLGPAADGRFYLFGIRNTSPEALEKLLDGIDMTVGHPLEQVMHLCQTLRLSLWVMETLGHTGTSVSRQAGNWA